eukprot:3527671-Alexandrium_andersonii.AAC.1
MPVSAALHPNPQSAFSNMQNSFRRSSLEPSGPRKGLEIAPPSSRGVRSAAFFAEIPNLLTKW